MLILAVDLCREPAILVGSDAAAPSRIGLLESASLSVGDTTAVTITVSDDEAEFIHASGV